MKRLLSVLFAAVLITSACRETPRNRTDEKPTTDTLTSRDFKKMEKSLEDDDSKKAYAAHVNDSISHMALMLHLGEADSSTPGIDGKGEGLMNIVQKKLRLAQFFAIQN